MAGRAVAAARCRRLMGTWPASLVTGCGCTGPVVGATRQRVGEMQLFQWDLRTDALARRPYHRMRECRAIARVRGGGRRWAADGYMVRVTGDR